MHIVRGIGQLHGRLAKWLLVSDYRFQIKTVQFLLDCFYWKPWGEAGYGLMNKPR